MKTLVKLSALLVLSFILVSCEKEDDANDNKPFTPTSVTPGDINSNTTWYTDSVYVIDKIIDVNAVLTIEAGTIIKIKEGVEIRCSSGTIKAIGDTDNPIIFTSYKDDSKGGDTNGDNDLTMPAKNDWNNISITGQNNASEFDYCEFYYGGGHNSYDYTLVLESSNSKVTNCTFANNNGAEYGVLNAQDAETGNVITGNIFYNNVIPLAIGGTIDIDNSNIFHNPDDSTITNTKNGIFYLNYNGKVEGNRSWGETEVPFVVANSYGVTINSGHSLTISPGVIVKMNKDMDISAEEGILSADATASKPIIFTSYHDDAHGGDTDGNGTTVSAAVADWHHISISGTNNSSILDNCLIYYGGGHGSYDYAVVLESNNTTVTNCTFANNKGTENGALNAEDAESGTVITGNTFYNNDIPLVIGGAVDIDDSNVFHNPNNSSEKNTKNGVFFMKYTGDIEGDRTWSETEVPFVIQSSYDLDISSGNSLTISADVVLKFDSGLGIDYDGSNLVNYNASNVYYTSYKDDDKKGDTNGDGTVTSASSGDWKGVYNTNSSEFETWSNILYAEN